MCFTQRCQVFEEGEIKKEVVLDLLLNDTLSSTESSYARFDYLTNISNCLK